MTLRFHSISLILAATALTSYAQTGKHCDQCHDLDAPRIDGKVAYQDRQYLGNVSYGSANPVSDYYMPITDIADIRVDYLHQNGDLHLIDEAGRSNTWKASFTGMKRVGKVTFTGGLTYDNSTLDDRRWNNTLFVSRYNPYIIGDSILSKFNQETFALDGAAVYTATDRLKLALRAYYNVGSSATQKDPRPEIKGMRFTLNPGAEYTLGNHAVGLSAHVGWLSEESSTTIVRTTTKQYVFLFQGLGVYEVKDALGYKRKYDGMRYGANIQFTLNRSNNATVSDFIELGYSGEYENATDGSSATRYKGGRYSGSGLSLYNRLRIKHGDRTMHNVIIAADMHKTTGRWYTQKQVTDDNNNLIYEVINESDNLEGHDYHAMAGYRFDLLDGTLPTLSASANADLDRSETKNRLYGAREEYTNLLVSADVTKRFAIRRSWLGATVRGQYGCSLDKTLSIDNMPATYSIIMQRYTRPAFDDLTAGYWGVGGSLTYSLPLYLFKYSTTLNIAVNADYRSQTGSTPTLSGADRLNIGASVGFIF